MAKKPSFVSPLGRLVFPHLNSPDTRFDSVGTYKVDLNPTDEEAQDRLKSLVDDWVEAAVAGVAEDRDAGVVGLDPRQKKAWDKANAEGKDIEANDPPYKEQDEEYGGGLLFQFKMNPEGRTRNGEKYERKPRLFDSQGQPIDVLVRTGSEGFVSFQPYLYYSPAFGGAGVSLRLLAVQITSLAEPGTAESFGFEAVDGYSIADESDDFTSGAGGDDEDADGYDFG